MNRPARVLAALALMTVSTWTLSGPYSGLYVFGDSLSDPGNLALAIGANPGQTITGNSYIPSQPYGSNQFSNGDVWAKTFASQVGLAPFGQPYLLGGGNFAFGGARVATDGAALPPSLAAQEGAYLGATGGTASASALYVVAGGGNDARDTFASAASAIASSLDPTSIIAAAALSYANSTGALVDQLKSAGAAHIVVWDVPDLGLAPAVAAFGASGSFLGTLVAQSMNGALSARLAGQSGVTLFDLFGLQDRWAANPSAYGLANVTDACGAIIGCDPSTYLFWDGIHPTSAGHALIANEMFAVAVPEPAEYVLMLTGLALVMRRIRCIRQRRAGA